MSTTEVSTIGPAGTLKDSTRKKKHTRIEIFDKPSKTPQSDKDAARPEEDMKREKENGKDAEAEKSGQEKDRKAKKRSRKEDRKLDTQTSEPPQAEQLVDVETPKPYIREKKRQKDSKSVKVDAGESLVQEEGIGESSEKATEKELKRARKEARRREKADRAGTETTADIPVDQQVVDSGDSVEKKKAKDKKKRKAESEDVKKSKKRRTGVAQDIPNPEEDEELSEQARKALSYAYAQFADEANWKFNKARQNWLLRNLWSESNVPEKFIPLLSKYFAKVQGGVRENLIKTCKTNLTVSVVASSPEVGTSATGAPQSVAEPDSSALSTSSEAMRSRARTILDALGVS